MGRSSRAFGALAAFVALGSFSSVWAAAVGTTAGTFEVTPGGSATYTIPITVPPGIAGLQPSLAITYDSSGDNGLLGAGFSLAGLSAITRCPSAFEPDGLIDGVDFITTDGAPDRFCVDGQRLMVMNGVAYGAVGAEYRTEIESFSRIVSAGGTVGNPASFTVWTKSGLIMDYGVTADSRWEAVTEPPTPGTLQTVCQPTGPGEPEVCRDRIVGGYTPPGYLKTRAWGVNKVSDTAGNSYTVTYIENATTGEVSPAWIQYTVPGPEPDAEVAFTYANRTDVSAGYVASALVTASKRLAGIVTRVGQANVRTYALDYDEGGHAAGSRLLSITECGQQYECLKPTTFDWSAPGSYAPLSSEPGTPNHYVADGNQDAFRSLSRYQWGDFNGDGRADLYYIQGYGASAAAATIYLSQYNVGQSGGNSSTMTGVTHFVGAGGDWGSCVIWCNTDTMSQVDLLRIKLADLDADGYTDVLVVRGLGNTKPSEIYLNNRNGGFLPMKAGPSLTVSSASLNDTKRTLSRVRLLDMNGDGLSDIYVVEGNGTITNGRIYINTGEGNFSPTVKYGASVYVSSDSTWATADVNRVKYGDFNGDGLTDIYVIERDLSGSNPRMPGSLWLQKSDGTWGGATGPVHYISTNKGYASTDVNRVQIADFNGDGNSDILTVVDEDRGNCPTKTPMKIHLGRGDGTFLPPKNGPLHCVYDGLDREERDVSRIKLADMNGDGLTDIYIVDGVNTQATPAKMYINRGDANFQEVLGPNHQVDDSTINETLDIARVNLADLTGDGASDVYVIHGWNTWSKAQLFRLSVTTGDRVTRITNGLDAVVEVDYRLMTDPALDGLMGSPTYTKDMGTLGYPNVNVQFPMWLASGHRFSNGLGGLSAVGHAYEGAKVHLKGRGFLGFAKYRSHDKARDAKDATTFNQDFPLTGTPIASITQLADGRSLAESVTDHLAQALPYGRHFVYLAKETSKSFEINGTNPVVTSTVTENAYTEALQCGNLKTSTVKVFEGNVDTSAPFVTQNANDYEPEYASQVCRGRLNQATVARTASNGATGTRTSSFEYDAMTGLLKAETVQPGGQWLRTGYARDTRGRITTTTVTGSDVVSRATVRAYTDSASKISITNTLGHTETQTYNPATGALLSLTGPNNRTTSWAYDGFGRKTLESRPDGTSTSFDRQWCVGSSPTCNGAALFKVRTDGSSGATAIAEYDILERPVASRTRSFEGRWVQQLTQYDEAGRVEYKSVPHFEGEASYGTTGVQYDDAGRIETETAPVDQYTNGTTTYTYSGLTTTQTNAKSQTATNTVNALGKVVSVRDDHNNQTRYEFDAFDNLVKTIDPAGNQVVMGYDIRGRKTSMADPDMGAWTYTYNALGELKTQKDAKNQTVQMSYDLLGRMTSRTDADGTATSWTFDAPWKGALTRVSSSNGYAHDHYYDALGRPTTVDYTNGGTYTFQYNYDSQRRVIRITYPGGLRVAQEYNAFGFMRRVSASDSPTGIGVQCSPVSVPTGGTVDSCALVNPASFPEVWHLETTDARGSPELFALSGVMDTMQSHDLATGHVTALMTSASGQPDVQSLNYDWDALGNLESRTDQLQGGLTETFAYDTLNRMTLARVLTSGTTAQIETSVTHNAIGNITSKSGVGTYAYGTRPHAVTGVTGTRPATYAYDANGNMLAGGGRTLTWTPFNLPATMTQGASSTSYTYGPERERIRQSTSQSLSGIGSSVGKDIVYAGGLYESHGVTGYGAGTFGKSYIHAGGRVVAVYTKPVSAAGSYQYLHYAHLGSVDVVTDAQGQVVERLSYDAFGKRRGTNWLNDTADLQLKLPHPTDRGYTSQEQLDGVGLIHYGGRVYDPILGRFTSADPFIQAPTDIQSYNRYAYVRNNPLSLTDPSGFWSLRKALRRMGGLVSSVTSLHIGAYEQWGKVNVRLAEGIARQTWSQFTFKNYRDAHKNGNEKGLVAEFANQGANAGLCAVTACSVQVDFSYSNRGGVGFGVNVGVSGFGVGIHRQERGPMQGTSIRAGYILGNQLASASAFVSYHESGLTTVGVGFGVRNMGAPVAAGARYSQTYLNGARVSDGMSYFGNVDTSAAIGLLQTADIRNVPGGRREAIQWWQGGPWTAGFQGRGGLASEGSGLMVALEVLAIHPTSIVHDWYVTDRRYGATDWQFYASMPLSFMLATPVAHHHYQQSIGFDEFLSGR